MDLKFDWTRNARRFVEDKEVLRELVPPSTLKQFALQGYSSASFPAWVMGIAPYLPNLLKIEMEDLPNCRILPPLGQLQNLQRLVFRKMDSIVKIDGACVVVQEHFLGCWNSAYVTWKAWKNGIQCTPLVRMLRRSSCSPNFRGWKYVSVPS